jgi:hypothetical protein
MAYRDKRVVGLTVLLSGFAGGFALIYFIYNGWDFGSAAVSAVGFFVLGFIICIYMFSKNYSKWFLKPGGKATSAETEASL